MFSNICNVYANIPISSEVHCMFTVCLHCVDGVLLITLQETQPRTVLEKTGQA